MIHLACPHCGVSALEIISCHNKETRNDEEAGIEFVDSRQVASCPSCKEISLLSYKGESEDPSEAEIKILYPLQARHITFTLDEAKRLLEEAYEILLLEPQQNYDEYTGMPTGYDKNPHTYEAALNKWWVEAEMLQSFLINNQAIKTEEAMHDPIYVGFDLRKFINRLEGVIGLWERGKYPRLSVSSSEHHKVYRPGDEYHYWKDLSAQLRSAKKEVFAIDPYTSQAVLDEFIQFVEPTLKKRFLTRDNTKENKQFLIGAKKCKFEISCRISSDIHDRVIFIDDKCIVSGASIKDAAVKTPTYLITITQPEIIKALKQTYEKLWDDAKEHS